jgi:hypothetical protein
MVKFFQPSSYRVQDIQLFSDMVENMDQPGGWVIVRGYNPLVSNGFIQYCLILLGVGCLPDPLGLPNWEDKSI